MGIKQEGMSPMLPFEGLQTMKVARYVGRSIRRYRRKSFAAAAVAAMIGASLGAPSMPPPIVQIVKVPHSGPLPFERLEPLHFYQPVAHVPETTGGTWLAISASDYYGDQNPARRKYPKLKKEPKKKMPKD